MISLCVARDDRLRFEMHATLQRLSEQNFQQRRHACRAERNYMTRGFACRNERNFLKLVFDRTGLFRQLKLYAIYCNRYFFINFGFLGYSYLINDTLNTPSKVAKLRFCTNFFFVSLFIFSFNKISFFFNLVYS